jgi:hypothetical protein
MLLDGKNGYMNASECYDYTCIACLVQIILNSIMHNVKLP